MVLERERWELGGGGGGGGGESVVWLGEIIEID